MHFSPIFEIHNLRTVAYHPFTFLGTICFCEELSTNTASFVYSYFRKFTQVCNHLFCSCC